MKAGFSISIAAHLIALAVILIAFSAPPLPDNQQTEEVPITLVPLGDVMALQKGEAEAEKKAKAAPKKTAPKPEVKKDAENAGNADIDTALPEKKNIKAREVKSPPPPKGEEQGQTEPQPEKQPEPRPAAPPPPPAQEAKPAAPAPPKPAEPAPPKPAAAAPSDDIADLLKANAADNSLKAEEQPKDEPKPQEEKPREEPKPKAPPLPEKAPVPAPRPPEQKKPEPKQGEKDGAAAASRNALIDRTRTSGGGAKRSQDEAAFGADKNMGDSGALQQTLNNVIGGCVARNWDIGVIQGSSAYDLRVQVHFRLNKDGSLAAEPELTPAGGDGKDRDVIATQARAALKKCAPFKLPAEKYGQWHDVTVNMRAFPE